MKGPSIRRLPLFRIAAVNSPSTVPSLLIVASASHVFARWRDRPVNLMLVPGILFLVPGSVGFLSLSSLLESDVVHAVETAFRMALIATALAAGVLVATAAVPPRNPL